MVPHDRAFMLRTFDQDLRPFVDQIVDERAMDTTEGSVRITLAQRSTLHKFASTLPGADGGGVRSEAWPSGYCIMSSLRESA